MVCDTPSHGSDHLCLIWKESIHNCRCYRADTACGTDGWTDGRTDGVKPVYPPNNFVIITSFTFRNHPVIPTTDHVSHWTCRTTEFICTLEPLYDKQMSPKYIYCHIRILNKTFILPPWKTTSHFKTTLEGLYFQRFHCSYKCTQHETLHCYHCY